MVERSALVLGAGLQGACTALALANAGYRITLVDQAPDCLLRASLRNEGKIHLGFVYANDPSCRTSSLMLDSALAFGPLLEDWIRRPVPWDAIGTSPFTYLILNDTLVPAPEILAAWERLQARFDERRKDGRSQYLGNRVARLWKVGPPGDPARAFFTGEAGTMVHTVEQSVALDPFREIVREALEASDRVETRYGHRVRTVARTSSGFRVDGTTTGGEAWTLETPVVVNCLWEGRLAIDKELGVLPARPWVYRLKYRLLGRLPPKLANLPSLTMVLGRFGDVVNYGDGRVYISWYPACLGGWSSDVSVPESWSRACGDGVPVEEAHDMIARTLSAFDAIIPGFRACQIDSVAAGVIFSWGRTDIDDLDSELHRRHEIGPAAHDGYITVNTGKLTSAPLFARRIVDLLR